MQESDHSMPGYKYPIYTLAKCGLSGARVEPQYKLGIILRHKSILFIGNIVDPRLFPPFGLQLREDKTEGLRPPCW